MDAAREAAQWFKGKRMVANKCELILVREWRDDCYILLCQETTHSEREHLTQFAALREKGIPVSHDNTVVLMRGELETVAPMLASCSEIERQYLRNALLTLKLSFRGRVLSADEFRQQAESATMATLGSRSRAGSGARINAPSVPAKVTTSHRPSSAAMSNGFKERLSRLSKAAAHSPTAHAQNGQDRHPWEDEAPTTTSPLNSPAPSMSLRERLKRLAKENGIPPAGTP